MKRLEFKAFSLSSQQPPHERLIICCQRLFAVSRRLQHIWRFVCLFRREMARAKPTRAFFDGWGWGVEENRLKLFISYLLFGKFLARPARCGGWEGGRLIIMGGILTVQFADFRELGYRSNDNEAIE